MPPARLVIEGEPGRSYGIEELPNLNVQSGQEATVPMMSTSNRQVTVFDRDDPTRKNRSPSTRASRSSRRLQSGYNAPVAFGAKPGKRTRAALAGLLVTLLAAGSAYAADPRAELEKARASFLARNWTEAESFLRPLIENEANIPDRALVSRARMYLGAALLEEGKQADAKQVFRDLALRDFSFDPDPLSFPSQAINLFIDVRASLQEEIHKAGGAERGERSEGAGHGRGARRRPARSGRPRSRPWRARPRSRSAIAVSSPASRSASGSSRTVRPRSASSSSGPRSRRSAAPW